ncbi:MAG TPA: hypothetical protein PK099_09370 [Saprospiraceae bacterium]|nr:hypothetical protein [Saprospiraceae bacterium]HNA65992.1 hypothetical protein [Saprospiraceae bacterium]
MEELFFTFGSRTIVGTSQVLSLYQQALRRHDTNKQTTKNEKKVNHFDR